MIAVIFNSNTDFVRRCVDPDTEEAPDNRGELAALISDDGDLTVHGWIQQCSSRRWWWWMRLPDGLAADYVDDLLDFAPKDFFTDQERRLIKKAIRKARS